MRPTRAGAVVVLLVALGAACAGEEQGPDPVPTRSSPTVTASASPTPIDAPPCDAEALRDAPALTAELAQQVSGAGVLVCDVTSKAGATPSYEVTQVGPEAAASPEHAVMVRLSAVDGGELPPDCEVVTTRRFLVLVGETWTEGRPVRCSGDS